MFSFCLPVVLAVPALILGFLGLREIRRSHGKLKGKGTAVAGMVMAVVASLVTPTAFLWVQQYTGERKARAESVRNLKELGQALRGYQEQNQALPPPAVYGPDGKPLLSWRVLLLPFLSQADLHKEFHLAEPWDSPHNKELLARMPQVYAPVMGERKEPGLTYYQVFVGDGTPFPPGPRGTPTGNAPRNPSNRILIVEAGEPVPWTRPQDLPCAPDQPLPKLGGLFRNGFHAYFTDGEVQFLPRTGGENLLRPGSATKTVPHDDSCHSRVLPDRSAVRQWLARRRAAGPRRSGTTPAELPG